MVKHVVKKIRNEYDKEVPIVLTVDVGFFDQENFKAFEKLGIGYVVGGKLYSDIEQKAESRQEKDWTTLNKEDGRTYKIRSFPDRRGSWKRSRKAIYTRLVNERGLTPFRFAQHRRIYYTNLGTDEELTASVAEAGRENWLTGSVVVELTHGRGNDELTHRSLKKFGTEKLPFQRFVIS